jgi:hypothetical protein
MWMETILKSAVGEEDSPSEPTRVSKDWLIYSKGVPRI